MSSTLCLAILKSSKEPATLLKGTLKRYDVMASRQRATHSEPCTYAVHSSIPAGYCYAGSSSWMTKNRDMCQSASTRHIIITPWSSLVGLGFSLSSCLPTLSTLWPSECQVSWKQCVGMNSLCGVLKTRTFDWIAQLRTGSWDLHTINTRSH